MDSFQDYFMQTKRLVKLSSFILLFVFALGCEEVMEDDVDDLFWALEGECTSTTQCKNMYGSKATDCKNNLGGVCYCGTQVCGDDNPPEIYI